jgi:hypothetical protein
MVRSIFPNWKFAVADTVAANGVHGALLVGKRHAIAPRKTEWQRELATFKVELYCDSKLVRPGGGSLVLDSPLAALRPLRAGEIISARTLTLATPVKLGECWTSTTLGFRSKELPFDLASRATGPMTLAAAFDLTRVEAGVLASLFAGRTLRDRRDAPRCQDNGKNAPRTRFSKDRRHAPTRELMRLWTDLVSPTGSNMWTSGRSV